MQMETIIYYCVIIGMMLFSIYFYYVLKKTKEKTYEYIESKTDKQNLNILYDAPTDDDKVGYGDYAFSLAKQIEENSDFMVYGIYGPWGSGKTSLMKMIKNNLPNATTIWFDAWKYKGKLSIFEALCQEIGLELAQRKHTLGYNKLSQGSFNYKVRYSVRRIKEFQFNIRILVDYINRGDNKIVIFVDDLDRCDVASAIDFLENLKVFFDIPRLNFVIGVNYEVLLQEIKKKYDTSKEKESNFSKEYLAKIVNVPFYIPSLDKETIENYIKENIEEERIRVASEVFAVANDGNLRSVKRIINSYKILLDVAANRDFDVDYILLAKILIIQYRFREWYQKMVYNPMYLYRIQRIRYTGTRRALQETMGDNKEMPLELRNLLDIRPYFTEENAVKYVQFLHKETFVDGSDYSVEQLLANIQKSEYEKIETLAILPEKDMGFVSKALIDKYCNETDKKTSILRLLSTVHNDEVVNFYYNIVLKEEDISLRLIAADNILRTGREIDSYISSIPDEVIIDNEKEQLFLVELSDILVRYGKKYCVDTIQRLINNIGDKVFEETFNTKIVDILRLSKDKKAIDILEKCFMTKNEILIKLAIAAIGDLDVDILFNWFYQFAFDEAYKNIFFTSIVENASINSYVVREIDLSVLIEIIDSEKNVDNKLIEIKLLQLITKRKIKDWYADNPFYADDDQFDEELENAKKILNRFARHDDNWSVRDLADSAFNDIIKFQRKKSLEPFES